MIFVDASALVALATNEPESGAFSAALKSSGENRTSALAVYEAVLAVARKTGVWSSSRDGIAELLALGEIQVIPIGMAEQEAALDAFERYGKGRNSAKLNMGDCFAYACAKTSGAKLLYKGTDFALTDITPAV